MFLFDSHLHFFSHEFFAALAREKAPTAEVDATLADLAHRTGIELPARQVQAHVQRWIAQLDRHGVQQALVFASVPEETVAVGEALRLAGGRFRGLFAVNPTSEGRVHHLYKCGRSFGFSGVMLFPALHHYHVDASTLQPFFDAAMECRLRIFVHFGILQIKLRDLLGLPRVYDSRFANPLDLQAVANRHPGLRFIIPHFGGGFWRETLMLGMQCENVLVDTSSSNSWMVTHPGELTLKEVFHRTKAVFGAERMLFGTDSGMFPRGWRKDIHEAQVQAMSAAGFSAAEQALVLGENAVRLFGGGSA